ncbi:MAG: ABC transporter substrate-binding protein [Lawsonibacter sp.]
MAAADDAWTSFDLNLGEDVVELGGVKQINLEQLAAAQPDLVLASSNTAAQLDLLPALEQLGLKVAYFKVAEFQDYLHMLDLCTQLTGDTDRFDQYGLGVERQVQAARGPGGQLRTHCPVHPGHRGGVQGEKQPGQRPGGDAPGPGLCEHRRRRRHSAGAAEFRAHFAAGPGLYLVVMQGADRPGGPAGAGPDAAGKPRLAEPDGGAAGALSRAGRPAL